MGSSPESSHDSGLEQRLDAALESFWRGSPAEFDRLLEAEVGPSDVCARLASAIEIAAADAVGPLVIGDYRVLRIIGRGGMAVVYEAFQERTARRVALKLVRGLPSGDDPHIRLFRREIELLARLKHPDIATLYDAGQTADGHPYFAMELVSGLALDKYAAGLAKADDFRSGTGRARLVLFSRICRAMHHAHQRGIIHCDLKPSNVMVDAEGNPKVLDFGLARLLDADLTLFSGAVSGTSLLGTLAYMSPEQAAGKLDTIDIRADIYALGVVLYEVLTGRRPYEVSASALPKAIRTICDTDPPKPGRLDRRLRGDLETIALKAMEKEPDRRYASAAALADDIDRYLANEPILARNPSALYHMQKLVVRHKLPAALIAMLFVATGVFAVVFAVQARRVAVQRDAARSQAARAERINAFLNEMLGSVDPRRVGPDARVRDVIDKAATELETALPGDLDVQAAVHDTLGRCYHGLRMSEKAMMHAQRALELRRNLYGERDALYAASLEHLGVITSTCGDPQRGAALVEQALNLRRELLGDAHPDVGESLLELGLCRVRVSDLSNAERLLRESVAVRRAALGEHRDVAESLQALGGMLVDSGRFDDAEPVLTEARDMQRRVVGPVSYGLARTLDDLAELYWARARFDQAEAINRERTAVLRELLGGESQLLANAMSDLGNVQEVRGELVEAETLYRSAIEMARRVGRTDDDSCCDLNMNEYAAFLRDQGRYAEAEPLCRRVYASWSRPGGWPQARAYAANNLGLVLLEQGREGDAEHYLTEAVDIWRGLFGQANADLAKPLVGLGRLHLLHSEHEAARQVLQEAVDICRARIGAGHPRTALCMVYLADAHAALQERSAEAEYQGALEATRQKLGDHHTQVVLCLAHFGDLKQTQADPVAAEALYREAIAVDDRIQHKQHPLRATCLIGLARIQMGKGDAPGAEAMLREALDIQTLRYGPDDVRTASTRSRLNECETQLSQSKSR